MYFYLRLNSIFYLGCTILIFSFSYSLKAQYVITETTKPKGWLIKTKSAAFKIIVTNEGKVKPISFGVLDQIDYGKKNAYRFFEDIEEVPVRGGLPSKLPVLEVVFKDKVRDADLIFVNAEITTIEGFPALKITQKDKFYPLEVTSYIRVLSEFNILEKWISVKNIGKKDKILIENLLSGSLVLPTDEYNLTQLSGAPYAEFQLIESPLVPGTKTIDIRATKSNFHAPWFMVRPQNSTGETGPTWFGSLHYSGNWAIHLEKAFNGPLQIVGGINFWDSTWSLEPGKSFETPKMDIGFTLDGPEGAQINHTAYIRKTVLPLPHRNELRPVAYNSWYATKQFLKEEQQLELAKEAANLGAELFVVDAGWYKVAGTDWSELGDWDVDKVKFPNGLTSLIKGVNDLGMKFGLWFEPESINISSETYKKHPDWAVHFQNREGVARKTLNLAKEEVYQHLLNKISTLLRENKIDYVKWDQNTLLRNPGWPEAPQEIQREIRIRMTQNLYRLIDELKKRFPYIWFESCTSGGGRTDAGIFSRMDLAWTSDNSSALERLMIQYGYLSAYPANTMFSWVVEKGAIQSLAYKFDVAMSGVLGISDNIAKWTEDDKKIAKHKIEVYKQIRPLVQQGTLHRLVSPFETDRSALQYNSEDSSSAVLICHNMARYLIGSKLTTKPSETLKLRGLDPQKKYVIKNTDLKMNKGNIQTGAFLMNVGIQWPVTKQYESKVITINEVNIN